MVEIIKYGKFKPKGKQKKKRQIILAHTSRNVNDYLQTLKFRFNGNFKRIPNYIITREGKIIQLLGNRDKTRKTNKNTRIPFVFKEIEIFVQMH